MRKLNVLLACEESQAVCIEFRKLGHIAFSCDIQECSGGHPEWHYTGDIFDITDGLYQCKCGNLYGNEYGKYGCCGKSKLIQWDLMIAFPPCTHLAVSGAAWFEQKRKDGRQQEGIDFFLKLANVDIKHIALENPVGIMSKLYRKPDQIIQPYFFGDEAQKTTCLWLKNLPKLKHFDKVDLFNNKITHTKPQGNIIFKNGKMYSFASNKWYKNKEVRSKARSKTFPGIAKAMAEQWGNLP